MPRKDVVKGVRPPMSPEVKAKIAESIREAAAKKREEMGIAKNPFESKPLELVKMRNQSFDPSLFEPMPTGKSIDWLFTPEGGIPRATNYMVVGDPGVGKSTVCLDIISDLANKGYKVLFISGEMTRIDLFRYVQRYPKFGNVDILFLGEYADDLPHRVVQNVLAPGYDIVLLDSFEEIKEAIREGMKVSGPSASKFLIDLMLSHNLGNNESLAHTAFLVIQQVTKKGQFLGSNKLKHMLTGMLELRFEEDGMVSYMEFTKNRRGPIGQKMYYSLRETGDVNFYQKAIVSPEGEEGED
jgi:predicted ATP-dependent serine protease